MVVEPPRHGGRRGRGHVAGRAVRRGHPAGRLDHGQLLRPRGRGAARQLLLAAHPGGTPITDVYRWVTDPRETGPGRRSCPGPATSSAAAGVQGVIDQPDRQRAGVYGTAKKMLGFMVDERLARWCVDDGSARPRFSAEAFATSNDTVYALSREGPGSAGPLTAAFTAGVMQAAEAVASRSPGGRLPVPLMPVLDEVANVCRWRELPDLYSHYGSRGIRSSASSSRGPRGSSAGGARAWPSSGRPPTSASTAGGPTRSSSWRGSRRSAVRWRW